jgi:hypothetical protein
MRGGREFHGRPSILAVVSGSDGTRTRDLRRDRPRERCDGGERSKTTDTEKRVVTRNPRERPLARAAGSPAILRRYGVEMAFDDEVDRAAGPLLDDLRPAS